MTPQNCRASKISQGTITAPPVIPAKEVTDEELRKNLGIHLASRLQSEDASKESTWADEDPDDDWVPEPIQWNDGTKSALQPEPSTPTPVAAVPITPTPVVSVVPVAKIVGQDTSDRVPEKPSEPKTLVFTRDPNKGTDKSEKGIKDAPPPRASPWATLPPPNIVPLPTPNNEGKTIEHGGSQHNMASREVPADEFNRSWRDRSLHNQLYNSQTGQLEPVQDPRNRGMRNPRTEQQLGKTSVLQRSPSQLSGSAEPSSAFQQTRTGSYRQDDYRRRRTSSNVSGGSGSTGRRLSFNKGIHGLERPLSPEETGHSPRHIFGPPQPPHQESQPLPVSQPLPISQPLQEANEPLTPQSATTSINTQNETVSTPVEDPIAMQKRIMTETRELARKRKLEEEAKEEAAKKERLRLKLEALEKEAEAKAAKATAEAEKAAEEEAKKAAEEEAKRAAEEAKQAAEQAKKAAEQVKVAAEQAKVAQVPVATKGTTLGATNSEKPNLNENNQQYKHATNNINNPETLKSPSPPNNQLLDQRRSTTDSTYSTASQPNPPPPPQTNSLASAPYRPGSFGNRSPAKKFSSIQPSSQSSISPTSTFVMPIRESRYDPTDPSGDRYANHGREFQYGSTNWHEKSNSRASPYGSIGDKSKFTETRNRTIGNQQYSNQNKILEKPQQAPDVVPLASATSSGSNAVRSTLNTNPTIPTATVESPTQASRTVPSAEGQQIMPGSGRHNVQARSPTNTMEKSKFNPWASYPEQLQREEEEDRRLAREKSRHGGFVVAPAIDESWLERKATDTEPFVDRRKVNERDHRGGSDYTNTPTSVASAQQVSRSNNSAEKVAISKPSSPPPAEFCPVTALDINSDEDNMSHSGNQYKKPVPHVRLPPPPSRATDSSHFSGSDHHNRQEPPRSPDVTRYDRVLGSIMKTIEEVSKGQQSSPLKTSAAPAKFSETKPAFTDDRDFQQQNLTTVSLPPSRCSVVAQAEPEDCCTNDEEDFLQRLYVQEFGSQPTVKIPMIPERSFVPARPPSASKSKKSRPKGFAESIPPFDIVGEDDFLNEQGFPYIPVRVGPDMETKKIPIIDGWSKPMRREPRKNANYNNSGSNSGNSNRKPSSNNGYFKKDTKPYLNQRQRMQSPAGPKPMTMNSWERQQQHPVVQ